MLTDIIKASLIAPCGMNCALCMGFQRKKDKCFGCNSPDEMLRISCKSCSIRKCSLLLESGNKYCYDCLKFPCSRLKNLDKRYRKKYGMSMIDNLMKIKVSGIRNFIKQEKVRWSCNACGSLICVHKDNCQVCGIPRNKIYEV